MGSSARAAFGIVFVLGVVLAASPAAAASFTPTVSGEVTDGGSTTATASPIIESSLFGETRAILEFDVSSLPDFAPILSATLSFDVDPSLTDVAFEFVVGTYDGDLTLSAGDFSPTFDDASFYSSGSFIGFTHFDLDVSSFLGATVDPSLVPAFNFRTTSSISGTLLNASLEVIAVPEPGAAGLLATGLLLLALPRRRIG
jgi:hypothetical protein